MQIKPTTVIAAIASHLTARNNCAMGALSTQKNREWYDKHGEFITQLCNDFLPSGSGIDNGVKFLDQLSSDRLAVFELSYHHMQDGVYTSWTDHLVRVRPTFDGIEMTVAGPNKSGVREYLSDTMHAALTTSVVQINGVYRTAEFAAKQG